MTYYPFCKLGGVRCKCIDEDKKVCSYYQQRGLDPKPTNISDLKVCPKKLNY